MSDTHTYQINIAVKTAYIEAQSDPHASRYVFAYTVTITNDGSVPVQLVTRHWIITDANDRIQEVRGDGVVGEKPRLQPGASYQYTSGTAIETPVGTMGGSYQMVAEDGTKFDAEIPAFTLSIPGTLH